MHHNNMTRLSVPRHPVVTRAIVSVTFRLPASLTARLARISAERKRKGERPFHQQDIVAEALAQWFRQHGVFD